MAIRIRCACCKDSHTSVAEVRNCHDTAAAEAAEATAEIWAEAIASWCSSGGTYADALIYAGVIASGQTWADYLRAQDEAVGREMAEMGDCDHGLSLALCCGPGHYPPDDPMDDYRD